MLKILRRRRLTHRRKRYALTLTDVDGQEKNAEEEARCREGVDQTVRAEGTRRKRARR